MGRALSRTRIILCQMAELDSHDAREQALLARRDAWYATLGPAEKMRLADELSETARAMALVGLRLRYPSASDAELAKRLFARCYGRDLSLRMIAWDPEVHGW